MTRYLGKARNVNPPAVRVGLKRAAIFIWGVGVVACAFLWFSCCGGVP